MCVYVCVFVCVSMEPGGGKFSRSHFSEGTFWGQFFVGHFSGGSFPRSFFLGCPEKMLLRTTPSPPKKLAAQKKLSLEKYPHLPWKINPICLCPPPLKKKEKKLTPGKATPYKK